NDVTSHVSAIPAAEPQAAARHFQSRLQLETDCWDVHAAMANDQQDFVLLDVRGPDAYRQAHVPGALNLPHAAIDEAAVGSFPDDTLFVVYCAGPHCNGAHRAAVR